MNLINKLFYQKIMQAYIKKAQMIYQIKVKNFQKKLRKNYQTYNLKNKMINR